MSVIQKTLGIYFIGVALMLLLGCSSGGGGDSDQTGNRGAPGNLLGPGSGGTPTPVIEFLQEHDGDGVNPPDSDEIPDGSPDVCFAACPSLGMLTRFSPTTIVTLPFAINSISYYSIISPPTCPGDAIAAASIEADFVIYEGGDTPGEELLRVPLVADAEGLGPAVPGTGMPPLKVFAFSPALSLFSLGAGAASSSFYAGVEFMNPDGSEFTIAADADIHPFPDPEGEYTASDPEDPDCPSPLVNPVPATCGLDPVSVASGRGTSYIKCPTVTGDLYILATSTTTPFPPSLDWIITLNIGG
jgi:hypothetical protein